VRPRGVRNKFFFFFFFCLPVFLPLALSSLLVFQCCSRNVVIGEIWKSYGYVSRAHVTVNKQSGCFGGKKKEFENLICLSCPTYQTVVWCFCFHVKISGVLVLILEAVGESGTETRGSLQYWHRPEHRPESICCKLGSKHALSVTFAYSWLRSWMAPRYAVHVNTLFNLKRFGLTPLLLLLKRAPRCQQCGRLWSESTADFHERETQPSDIFCPKHFVESEQTFFFFFVMRSILPNHNKMSLTKTDIIMFWVLLSTRHG